MSVAREQAPPSITVRAPAKINLHLGVGAPREDGFHPLDTVYQAISLYDDVTVTAADDWSVEVVAVGAVDISGVPLDGANIVVRAGEMLSRHHGIDRRAHVRIAKGIPVAGGMAGGSADAAATLVGLDRLWDLDTSDADLLSIAAELGSDVPFALIGGTARGSGRGELVEPVDDEGSWWWVVIPDGSGLSTPAVYAEFDRLDGGGSVPRPADSVLVALRSGDFEQLDAALYNDLQEAALSLRPELAETIADADRAHANQVIVSGSGPTLLTLIGNQEDALTVRQGLLDAGRQAVVATGPVAGAHVVEYV